MRNFVIVIPVYNDWSNLNRLLKNLNLVAKNNKLSFSILVINDFSNTKPKIEFKKNRNIIRFNLLIMSGLVLGKIAHKYYGDNVVLFQKQIIKIFFYNLILSSLILYIFPNSTDLWVFLKSINITIYGDPHVNRLVSFFFDPNFYSLLEMAKMLKWPVLANSIANPLPIPSDAPVIKAHGLASSENEYFAKFGY